MQLNFNRDKREFIRNGVSNFISDFIIELSNYLQNYNTTYCVMSDVDKYGQVYVVAQNGSGAGENIKLKDLPIGTERGTILKNKYGKFVIDKELTQKSIETLNELKESNKKILEEYKTENVDYLVTKLGDDYVILKNQETGLEFDTIDLEKEVFNNIHEGMILTCKNGKYVEKNN